MDLFCIIYFCCKFYFSYGKALFETIEPLLQHYPPRAPLPDTKYNARSRPANIPRTRTNSDMKAPVASSHPVSKREIKTANKVTKESTATSPLLQNDSEKHKYGFPGISNSEFMAASPVSDALLAISPQSLPYTSVMPEINWKQYSYGYPKAAITIDEDEDSKYDMNSISSPQTAPLSPPRIVAKSQVASSLQNLYRVAGVCTVFLIFRALIVIYETYLYACLYFVTEDETVFPNWWYILITAYYLSVEIVGLAYIVLVLRHSTHKTTYQQQESPNYSGGNTPATY